MLPRWLRWLRTLATESDNRRHRKANEGTLGNSIFDDIIYYWTKSSPQKSLDTPTNAGFYAKGVAVANWMNALEYIKKCVAVLEYSIEANSEVNPQKKHHQAIDGLGWLEDNLSILYHWKRTRSEFSIGWTIT